MVSDEDLVTRSRHDPAAFEPLVERHAAAVHAYLTRRCGTAADDLLSEVWLAAYAHRSDYDVRRGTVRAWLFGIARNHVLAYWRRAGRHPAAAPAVAHSRESDQGAGWDAADERLDAASMTPALRAALRDLPDVEREVLLLVAWEELTPGEAAQAVGIAPGTVRSRLHRARARMRKALGSAAGPARAVPSGGFPLPGRTSSPGPPGSAPAPIPSPAAAATPIPVPVPRPSVSPSPVPSPDPAAARLAPARARRPESRY